MVSIELWVVGRLLPEVNLAKAVLRPLGALVAAWCLARLAAPFGWPAQLSVAVPLAALACGVGGLVHGSDLQELRAMVVRLKAARAPQVTPSK
jgi:hypothetical protein